LSAEMKKRICKLMWSCISIKKLSVMFSVAVFLSRTCNSFLMFLIVSLDFPCFLSSHNTLNILSLTAFGCRGWCAGRNPPFVYV